MARRIRRRRRVSKSLAPRQATTAAQQGVTSESTGGRAAPVTRLLIAAPGNLQTILASKISSDTGIQLAGMARDEMTTIEKALTEEAEVVAIDINLGGRLAGLDIAWDLSKASPEVGVLVMVSELDGADVRRRARRFGTTWSYTLTRNLLAPGTEFTDIVLSVGGGIAWIDPEMRPMLEAVWRVAREGRDMEINSAVEKIIVSRAPDQPDDEAPSPEPIPGKIQTMQTGRGGTGTDGFNVSKAS